MGMLCKVEEVRKISDLHMMSRKMCGIHFINELAVRLGDINGHMDWYIDGFDDVHGCVAREIWKDE